MEHHTMNLSDRLTGYLTSWYATTVQKQTDAGNTVTLSFQEFIDLFTAKQLASLQSAIDADRLRYLQRADNQYAYVVTWRSYAACSEGVFSKETACVCSRMKSAKINLPKPGDKLRPGHVAKIASALTGKAKSEDHKQAISDATKGVSKKPWSEERKAARSAQRRTKIAASKENK